MAEYAYDQDKVSTLLSTIIRNKGNEKANNWLQQRLQVQQQTGAIPPFNQTFTAIPRFTGNDIITLSPLENEQLQQLLPSFFVQGWPLSRLARVWWLLQLPVTDKALYLDTLEKLFNAAEMNELAALYSALPLLPWPEEWIARTSEGIRSNIGIVQEAIMLHNPYPAKYLPEPAWNQLVMKAIFTDKPLHLITGLDERANSALVNILVDFAHERWAAGRTLDPMQWRILVNFVNENNLGDIARVLHSLNSIEQEAGALVCAQTNYAPAKALLAQYPALATEIQAGRISWDTLAQKNKK
ncbi:MAG: EboA domain-containing protein [Chitinophaga sp.]|uniref:EboA domain-containing protein n=1 Tax=Chitinophaga sp. TaxID=1869181 RepID=UPI001B271E78|nr:EboA domain-containing protein [Chitinophaga sp.]MBO9729455.1 EboA domain-containing protein [Chitinophaga sp.]